MRPADAGRLRPPYHLLQRPARRGATLRGLRHPAAAPGRSGRSQGRAPGQPERARTDHRFDLAASAVRRRHQKCRSPARCVRQRSESRDLRQHRRHAARCVPRVAGRIRLRENDPRRRYPRRTDRDQRLARSRYGGSRRTDRIVPRRRTVAGDLHRYRQRRDAFGPVRPAVSATPKTFPEIDITVSGGISHGKTSKNSIGTDCAASSSARRSTKDGSVSNRLEKYMLTVRTDKKQQRC